MICTHCQSNSITTTPTKYGPRYDCLDCGAYRWGGETSTFAMKDVHTLRYEVKKLFIERKRNHLGRARAYKWLRKVAGVPGHKAHFGMFKENQLLRLKKILER